MQKDKVFSVKSADESSGFLLWQVTNLWQREIKKALTPFNITHSQFVLMASIHWLTLHKTEVTQIILSNHTKIDPMTTSTVLRTLEKKKILKRQESQIDTRAKIIELTEEGINVTKSAIIVVEKFDNQFFSKLDNKGEFNLQLLKLLKE